MSRMTKAEVEQRCVPVYTMHAPRAASFPGLGGMKQIEDQRFGSAGANGCPSLGTMRRTGAILFLSLVVFCTFSICIVQKAQLELPAPGACLLKKDCGGPKGVATSVPARPERTFSTTWSTAFRTPFLTAANVPARGPATFFTLLRRAL